MRYSVTFRKRFNFSGEPSDNPRALLNLADDVVEDAEFVQIIEPPRVHASEDISGNSTSESSEGDGFLGFGTETWIYDVGDGREEEFKHALAASEVVIEYQEFDDDMVRQGYASP